MWRSPITLNQQRFKSSIWPPSVHPECAEALCNSTFFKTRISCAGQFTWTPTLGDTELTQTKGDAEMQELPGLACSWANSFKTALLDRHYFFPFIIPNRLTKVVNMLSIYAFISPMPPPRLHNSSHWCANTSLSNVLNSDPVTATAIAFRFEKSHCVC